MTKAMLIMDTPKDCLSCPCGRCDDGGEWNRSYYCKALDRKISYENWNKQKPSWCPLREVKEGEWIFKYEGTYNNRRAYCSVCGKRSGIGGIKENQMKPYCPNCGAKMVLKAGGVNG